MPSSDLARLARLAPRYIAAISVLSACAPSAALPTDAGSVADGASSSVDAHVPPVDASAGDAGTSDASTASHDDAGPRTGNERLPSLMPLISRDVPAYASG